MKKLRIILVILYIIGFILYFVKSLQNIGAITLIAAVALHVVYTFSPQQRAAVSLLNARRMCESGNIEKAYQYVKQYLRLSNDKSLIGYLLTTPEKAYPYYEKLASMLEKDIEKESNSLLKYLIASIYYNIKKLDKAIEMLKRIPKKKLDTETVRLFGTALLENGNVDEAIQIFKLKENKKNTTNANELLILIGLGLAYAEKGEKDKAEQYYNKVKKINPSMPELTILKEKIAGNEDNRTIKP